MSLKSSLFTKLLLSNTFKFTRNFHTENAIETKQPAPGLWSSAGSTTI